MTKKKVYTIIKKRGFGSNKRTSEHTGTLNELIEYFSYTLETGKSYEHEKGNKKINIDPKSIKSLITNVNNALNNSASNGYSSTCIELKTE